jgi:hypothetical protein
VLPQIPFTVYAMMISVAQTALHRTIGWLVDHEFEYGLEQLWLNFEAQAPWVI